MNGSKEFPVEITGNIDDGWDITRRDRAYNQSDEVKSLTTFLLVDNFDNFFDEDAKISG